MDQDFALIAKARRRHALARRVRRRAQLDIVLIGALTGMAAMIGGTTHEALMAGSLSLSLGILVYVIRRDRDLVALAGEDRWRQEALDGRGLSLRDWRRGAELPPWEERRRGLDVARE